jgi:hypothetical protein
VNKHISTGCRDQLVVVSRTDRDRTTEPVGDSMKLGHQRHQSGGTRTAGRDWTSVEEPGAAEVMAGRENLRSDDDALVRRECPDERLEGRNHR